MSDEQPTGYGPDYKGHAWKRVIWNRQIASQCSKCLAVWLPDQTGESIKWCPDAWR